MSDKNKWKGRAVPPEVLEAANQLVQSAAGGDYTAGRRLVVECVTALREIVEAGTLPDVERQVYLAALLESLEAIVDGVNPARAMGLERPDNRPEDPLKDSRDFSIFMFIGRAYDELVAKGLTRGDQPMAQTLALAAEKFKVKQTTVQKVWSDYGSLQGWSAFKTDLK